MWDGSVSKWLRELIDQGLIPSRGLAVYFRRHVRDGSETN